MPAPPAVDAAAVDAAVSVPSSAMDGGAAADLRPRDVYVPPPPPAPNGPWPHWESKDIGPVPRPSSVWSSLDNLLVESVGLDIGGTADSFHFISRKVSGDFEILARVDNLQLSSPESTAGLMVRANDSDPGAAHVFLGVFADRLRGGSLMQRPTAGAPAVTAVRDPEIRDGQWLRLVRQGRTFTGYRSPSRENWVRIGAVELDLPAEVPAGLAVAARHPQRATYAEIEGLRMHNLDSQPATKGWNIEELGPAVGGIATHEPEGLKLAALAEPVSLLQDSGLFAFQTTEGEQMLTVKVEPFSHDRPGARLGLMVRAGPLSAVSRSGVAAIVSVTAGMGVQFMGRPVQLMMGMLAPGVAGARAPVWLRLTRREVPGQPSRSSITGSYSIDGTTFTQVGSTTFSLPEPFLIGPYVTSSGGSTPVVVTLSNLSLTRPPPISGPPAGAGSAPDAGTSEVGP